MFFLLLSHDHNTYHRRFRDTWRKWAKEVTRPFAFQPKALEMFENQYKSELLIRSHPRGRGFESRRFDSLAGAPEHLRNQGSGVCGQAYFEKRKFVGYQGLHLCRMAVVLCGLYGWLVKGL